MGLSTEAGKKTQKPIPPAGQTLGKCFAVIDLGTQMGTFNGAPKESKQVYMAFELPAHRAVFDTAKGPQVMIVSNEYTFSLGTKANFRKMLDSWFAKPIEKLDSTRAKKMLGMSAMIQVSHNPDKKDASITYANIAQKGISVFPVPPGTVVDKTTENAPIYFDLDEYTDESFAKVPKYLQDKIIKSPEYKKIKGNAPAPTGNAIVDAQGANFNQAEEEDF